VQWSAEGAVVVVVAGRGGEPAFGERERERESEIKNEEVLGLNTVFNFFFFKKIIMG
jgi:hypothetical protein